MLLVEKSDNKFAFLYILPINITTGVFIPWIGKIPMKNPIPIPEAISRGLFLVKASCFSFSRIVLNLFLTFIIYHNLLFLFYPIPESLKFLFT